MCHHRALSGFSISLTQVTKTGRLHLLVSKFIQAINHRWQKNIDVKKKILRPNASGATLRRDGLIRNKFGKILGKNKASSSYPRLMVPLFMQKYWIGLVIFGFYSFGIVYFKAINFLLMSILFFQIFLVIWLLTKRYKGTNVL